MPLDPSLADTVSDLLRRGHRADALQRLRDAGAPEPLLAAPLGWAGPVAAIDVSPDGALLAVVHGDLVSILDAADGRERLRLAGHAGAVRGATFDPAGRRLVSSGSDRTLRVWDTQTGAPIGDPVRQRGEGTRLLFFSDRGELVTLVGHELAFRDPQTLAVLRTSEVEYMVSGAVSRDGARWAAPQVWKTIDLVDVETGEELRALEKTPSRRDLAVDGVVFSRDGRRLAAGSRMGDAWIWDVDEVKPLLGWPAHDEVIGQVAFRDDGALLATVSQDRTAKIWDTKTGALVRTLSGHSFTVEEVVFHPDGKRLFTIGRDGTELLAWSLDRQEPEVWLRPPADEVFSLAVSSRGVIAAGSVGRTMLLRPDGSVSPLGEYSWATYGVAFSPSGARVAGGGADGIVRVWDATTGALVATLARDAAGVPQPASDKEEDEDEEDSDEHDVGSVAWSGEEVVVAYDDGEVVRWRVEPPSIVARRRCRVTQLLGDGTLAVRVIDDEDEIGGKLAAAIEAFREAAGEREEDEGAEEDGEEEDEEAEDEDEGDEEEEAEDGDDGEGDDEDGDEEEEDEDAELSAPARLDGKACVVVLEVASGEVKAVLERLPSGPRKVALRGDGKSLASTEYPRTLRVWDLASGRCTAAAIVPAAARMFDPHLPLAFGDDGALYCGDNAGAVHRLDPQTLTPVRSVRPDRDGAFALVTTAEGTSITGDGAEARRHVVGTVGAICLPGEVVSA